MANNKIILGDEVLMDLTGDTVTPETLAEGYTAHGANGELIVGTATKVNMSDYFETVNGDTIVWDGNTSGYNVYGMCYHVSDAIPTLEDLYRGGVVVVEGGQSHNFFEDRVIDANTHGIGDGCAIIISELGTPLAGVVFKENATITLEYQGQQLRLTFGKAGTYMAHDPSTGSHNEILTIDGYTGFQREVIKREYIPNHSHEHTRFVSQYEFQSKKYVTQSDLEAYIEEALLGGAW